MPVKKQIYFTKVGSALKDKLKLYMQEICKAIKADIKESINTPYPPASQQGSPPHRRTGDLYRSIHYRVKDEGNSIKGYISADVDYAQYLEPPGWLKRPFIAPAVERAKQNINIILGNK